jgi:hypothetical protein
MRLCLGVEHTSLRTSCVMIRVGWSDGCEMKERRAALIHKEGTNVHSRVIRACALSELGNNRG